MLICPQCQTENPETHRFCQACGVSLSQVACPECGVQVERSHHTCPNCGTETGQTRWVLIHAPNSAATDPASATVDTVMATMTPGQALDPQQRYVIQTAATAIASASPTITNSPILGARVLDHQPLQLTPLDQVRDVAQTIDAPELLATSEIATIVPAAAHPYLALAEILDPAVPYLYDAWYQDGRTILVLEDRSDWPAIAASWGDESLDPLQMVWWLHELTRLWGILANWDCCSSLTDLTNLCVDEDQILCLRLIYPDNTATRPTLKDLGTVWRQIFTQAQRTLSGALALLCEDLAVGKLADLEAVQTRLGAIADELQPDAAIDDWVQPVDAADNWQSSSGEATEPWQSAAPLSPAPDSTLPKNSTADAASPKPLPVPEADPVTAAASEHPLRVGASASDETAVTEAPLQRTANQTQSAVESDDSSPFNAVDPVPPSAADADERGVGAVTAINMVTQLQDDDDLDDSPTIVLPMRLLAIEDAGLTDVGQQRKHNEDTYSISLDVTKTETPIGRTLHARGLYVLCDGMGGHAGGEVASALAVDVLREYFDQHWGDQLPPESVIRDGIVLANKAIFDINQQNARFGSGRMGTTLVMLFIQDTHAIVAHVGDSRAYRYSRRLGLEQVTTDHEVGQREMRRGVEPEIAYARPDAYQLTQALGPRDEQFISPSFEYLDLSEDTLLLLCSDGLSDNDLLEFHSETHVEPLLSSSVNLERGVVELINLANQHNGHDNITAIAVRVKVRPKVNNL